MAWLKENVHAHGSSRSGEEILVAATGKSLDPEVFMSHLRARYLGEA